MTYNERIFKKQQITINKAECDKHHLRDIWVLWRLREKDRVWLSGQRKTWKGQPLIWLCHLGRISISKKRTGIPGGRNSQTEQKYVLSKMCLGISICCSVWQEPSDWWGQKGWHGPGCGGPGGQHCMHSFLKMPWTWPSTTYFSLWRSAWEAYSPRSKRSRKTDHFVAQ